MRLFILASFVLLALNLSFVSMAQDKPASSETREAQPSETQPKEDTEKRPDEDHSEKADPENENFDLDSYFKQGEENSKKGFGCERPPDPIS